MKDQPDAKVRNDCRTTELVKGFRYFHANTKDDGECYDGCCDDYICLDCGTRFRIEAAQ